MVDLRGEREIVNSKSEDEEEEKECDGEGGRVWDLEFLSVLLPIWEREREMGFWEQSLGETQMDDSYIGFENSHLLLYVHHAQEVERGTNVPPVSVGT